MNAKPGSLGKPNPIYDIDVVDENGNPCAIGEGKNDILGILRASAEIGVEWVVVENDDPTPDGLSDVQRSIEWIHHNYKG